MCCGLNTGNKTVCKAGELAAALCGGLFSRTTGCRSPQLLSQAKGAPEHPRQSMQGGRNETLKRDAFLPGNIKQQGSLVWTGMVLCVREFGWWLAGPLGTRCFSSMVSVTHMHTHESPLNKSISCWTGQIYSAAPENMFGHCTHWF